MSYSFTIAADTKDALGEKVDAELGRVVLAQPAHAADRQLAQDAAEAAINVLDDHADSQQIQVSVSGSLAWREEGHFTSASVSVNAAIVAKA